MDSLDAPAGITQTPFGSQIPTHDLSLYDLQFRELLDTAKAIIRKKFGADSAVAQDFEAALQGALEGKSLREIVSSQGKKRTTFQHHVSQARKHLQITQPEIAEQMAEVLWERSNLAASHSR